MLTHDGDVVGCYGAGDLPCWIIHSRERISLTPLQ